MFNPTVQGQRFDPDGDYVRRYVPELRAVKDGTVHDPAPKVRRAYDYPDPIVDHREAIAEYKERHARQCPEHASQWRDTVRNVDAGTVWGRVSRRRWCRRTG